MEIKNRSVGNKFIAEKISPSDKTFNVILDLDNTIISAITSKEAKGFSNEDTEKALKFTFHNMEDYYVVFERPEVQKFLDFLFDNVNVSVWSSATKDYVAYIIEKVILAKPKRKINWFFFSYHCEKSEKEYNGIKDLRMIWDKYQVPGFHSNNTIIIDDLKKVKKINKGNCLQIKDFEFFNKGSENDAELVNIRQKLEKILEAYNEGSLNQDNLIESQI